MTRKAISRVSLILSLSCLLASTAAAQVPAPIAETPAGYNCEPLDRNFQVRWLLDGSDLKVELIGKLGETFYMAFGPGGSENGTQMLGSDPVVADFFEGEARAVDFFISARALCFRNGVCPDNSNDVSAVSGERNDSLGISLVRYTRPMESSDDKDITIDPDSRTFISWAYAGTFGRRNLPSQHTFMDHARGDFNIVFGRPTADNCEPLVTVAAPPPGPTDAPAATDAPRPTRAPRTPAPTPMATAEPTRAPRTPSPTDEPEPTRVPKTASPVPTAAPTDGPPTAEPTAEQTAEPTMVVATEAPEEETPEMSDFPLFD